MFFISRFLDVGYVHHIRFHTFIFLINSSIQMMMAMDRQYQFDQAISEFSCDFIDFQYSFVGVLKFKLRAYSFGHLLKTVELVEDNIPFFWYPSTENGRLRRLQIASYESLFFWSFCFR